MDILEFLRQNEEVTEMLCDLCDIKILPDFKLPQDEFGHLVYSIPGKTFAKDNAGSEYILLEDGSVGYWGSEGKTGRISDNIINFFEFMVNCPYWKNYVGSMPYEDIEELRRFTSEIYEEHVEAEQEYWDEEFSEVQKELAENLGVNLYDDVAEKVLIKFYHSATREPRLIATYTEEGGSTHCNSGSLFEE